MACGWTSCSYKSQWSTRISNAKTFRQHDFYNIFSNPRFLTLIRYEILLKFFSAPGSESLLTRTTSSDSATGSVSDISSRVGSLLGSIRAKTTPQSAPSQDSGKKGDFFQIFGFSRKIRPCSGIRRYKTDLWTEGLMYLSFDAHLSGSSSRNAFATNISFSQTW